MSFNKFLSVTGVSLLSYCSPLALAQESQPDASVTAEQELANSEANFLAQFNWITSGKGEISNEATIEIPEGFRFLDGSQTAEVMEAFGNLPDTYNGMIGVDDLRWFVIFQFEDSGYVKDSEKDDLDADELLESLQEQEKAANEERKRRGLDTLATVGWAKKPRYNEQTNNLEWGVLLEDSAGNQNVNYLTKILGRRGIMHTTLICDPEELDSLLPQYQSLLTGYQYNPGKTYAEFKEGDKVADIGLKALIAGGAIYGAAKLGLLAKIGLFFKKGFKLIILVLIGIGLFVKRIITGKKANA